MFEFSKVFSVLLVFAVILVKQDQVLGHVIAENAGGHDIVERSASVDGEWAAGSGDGDVTILFGSGDGELPPECTEEFRNEVNHTMCKFDDPRVIETGVTEQQKQEIVDLHNSLRANVDPAATDMLSVVWDDNVAAVAQKLTQQCIMKHDSNRGVPSYGLSVGQNLAAGQADWEGAIMAWYNEVNLYTYGQEPNSYLGAPDGWKKIGHYTQVVQNTAFRIGCGFSFCESTTYGRFYACNYMTAQTKLSNPYTAGDRCAACPNSCNNGLCDCGGKACFNGGTLDIDSCTCSCPSLYGGPNCDTLNCPAHDPDSCWKHIQQDNCGATWAKNACPFMCGICGGPDGATPPPVVTSMHGCTYSGRRPSAEECSAYGDHGADTRSCASVGGSFDCAACDTYSNVKTDYCPVMCGYCDEPTRGTFTSAHGCEYRGVRKTKEECSSLGNNGQDSWACASNNGQFDCDACVKYSNVKTQYCPVMCGLCDVPCGGKVCLNKGRLDQKTCKCSCRRPFSGDTCENVSCPRRDKRVCQYFDMSYCFRVPEDCPYMCGLCSDQSSYSAPTMHRNSTQSSFSAPTTLRNRTLH